MSNLGKIAQKIKQNDWEDNQNPFRVTDMLKAKVSVRELRQVLICYELIHNEMPFYKIIKV